MRNKLSSYWKMPIEEKPRESMHIERIQIFAPQAEARIMKGNTRAGSTLTKYKQI
jgi:hypothetical protein